MRIVSVELKGFRRMALNGIQRFKLKPTMRVQLILGANGSGKSSLIAELTPLPADKANYTKDGSKTIVIEHVGNKYILTSDFGAEFKHSFKKNDEELNDGGTVTVQRELVKSEFGITQETHDICTGVEKFTAMSPSRRREILTQLDETDHTYALKVFAKAKEVSRDTTGALKLAKKRLVTEMSKLVSDGTVSSLEKEIQGIVTELDILYRNRTSNSRTVREIEDEQETLEMELHRLSKKVLTYRFTQEQMWTPDEIKEDIDMSRLELTSITTRIELASKEHDALRKTHEAFLKTGNESAESLIIQIEALKDKRNGLLSSRKLGLEFTDVQAAKTAIKAIEDNAGIVMVEFKENKDRRFSQQKLQEWRDKGQVTKEQINKINKDLDTLNHQKLHMEALVKGEETECPKCTHKWHPGYSKKAHDMVLELIGKSEVTLGALKLVLKNTEEEIFLNEQYGVTMRDWLRMIRATPVLNPFWDYLREEDIVHTYPRQASTKFDHLTRDVDLSCEALEIDKEIIKLRDLHELALKATSSSVGNVTERLSEVENGLGMLTKQLSSTQAKIQTSQVWLSRTQEFLANEERVRQYLTQMESSTKEMIVSIRNEIINNCLRQLQVELARRQSLLGDFKMQQGIVDDIAKQVKILETQEMVQKLIVTELSPTDGLIAEGLLGFIRSFVRKMNVVIRKIWTYRLEVQDCHVGDGDSAELDYRFPLLVADEDNLVPDVGKSSLGQREVVDLAFRIVATSYYGLNDAPLFLDEFGTSLDQEHRVNAVAAIKSILEQLAFSQLYMVSHYEEHHGAFTSAERCYLSKTNTFISGTHNLHVEIE